MADGDSCTTSDGRSGYMVGCGKDGSGGTCVAGSAERMSAETVKAQGLSAGDACTTSDGRSGYMVSCGDKGELMCVAENQS